MSPGGDSGEILQRDEVTAAMWGYVPELSVQQPGIEREREVAKSEGGHYSYVSCGLQLREKQIVFIWENTCLLPGASVYL